MISQYVVPFVGLEQKVLGSLQVDLGDMSNSTTLPPHLEELLRALAGQIAPALWSAMRLQELRLSELFDRAVAASLTKTTVLDAAQKFVDVVMGVPDLFAPDSIHLRLAASNQSQAMADVELANPDGKFLRLVAGCGEYYEAAREERPIVSVEDGSPTAKTFKRRESTWVNSTEEDEDSQTHIAGLPKGRVRQILGTQYSYASLVIRGQKKDLPIGVITVSAANKWFFSESLWQSMQTLGQRLFFALENAKKVEQRERRAAEVRFLLETTPLPGDASLQDSLQSHIKKVALAAHADIASFYLHDTERDLLVLRGQYGWKDPQMIGKAFYSLKKGTDKLGGVTPTVARGRKSEYIRDLEKFRKHYKLPPSRYEKEMFGKKGSEVRYEAINLPLEFKNKSLGVLTMQNAVEPDCLPTKFVTTNPEVLSEVALNMSAFVSASQSFEEQQLDKVKANRFEKLDELLLRPELDTHKLAGEVCELLGSQHDLEACAIYFPDENSERLHLTGAFGLVGLDRPTAAQVRDVSIEDTILGKIFKSIKWESFVISHRVQAKDMSDTLRSFERLLPSQAMNSLLVLPIREQNRPSVGVIVLWNIRNHGHSDHPWFTQGNTNELKLAASHISRRLERIEAERLRVALEINVIEERMAFNGAILTNLVHYLRNRIQVILSDIRTIADDSHESEEQAKAARIEDTAERLASRMNMYLDTFGRGSQTPQTVVRVNAVVSRALKRCSESAERQGVSVGYPPDCQVTVRAAEVELEDACFNLIDNAINATRQGGTARVQIKTDAARQEVRIEITDQGDGIPASEMKKILGGVYKSKKDGRPALGVFLSRFTIVQHEGKLEYSATATKGTMTTVTLPINTA